MSFSSTPRRRSVRFDCRRLTRCAPLENLVYLPDFGFDPGTCPRAVELHERHQVSYWDAGILAAAQRLGCHSVYSEDLNHGQVYDGVTVINPFLAVAPPS